MLEKLITNIAMTAMSKRMKTISKEMQEAKINLDSEVSDDIVEIVDTMNFAQSGTFRGYKRYRLTIYKEPGVGEGINHFQSENDDFHFEIEHGLPIQLLIKKVSDEFIGERFRVMEVYVDGYKIGAMYNSNSQYERLFSMPFDKVHVRIEGPERIIYPDGIEYRPIVYLFVHYTE